MECVEHDREPSGMVIGFACESFHTVKKWTLATCSSEAENRRCLAGRTLQSVTRNLGLLLYDEHYMYGMYT